MAFVRSWMRALLGASAAMLLVPAGLVLAVAVAATLGGSGLGGIGQVFGGPALPAGGQVAAGGGGEHAARHAATVAPLPELRRGTPGHGAAPGETGVTRRPAARRGPARRVVERPSSKVPAKVPSRPPASTTPAPSPAPAQPPQSTPESPVRRIGKALQDTVRPLPVVGPPAADAVGTVVDLIAPPPPSAAPRAAPAAPAPAPVAAPATPATPAITAAPPPAPAG